MTLFYGQSIFIIGGSDENIKSSDSVYELNLAAKSFNKDWPPLKQARRIHSATVMGRKIYVFGGINQ